MFLYFIFATYFSKKNINEIQNRILNTDKKNSSYNLPMIKNDTEDIILYNPEEPIDKKIKKRKIWDLLN